MGLLKEIAPTVARVVVVLNAGNPASPEHLQTIEMLAPSLGVQVIPARVRDVAAVEGSVAAIARDLNGGMIVLPGVANIIERAPIVEAAARHRLPAVYPERLFAAAGGLTSYGLDPVEQWHRAASYVDRILKGEKPADLPVQNPIKYEFVINLKTAKALGLDVPPTLSARADEIIE